MPKRISEETKQSVIAMSRDGEKVADIAEKTGVSVPSISKIRKEAGIGRSRKSKQAKAEVTTSEQLQALVTKALWPYLSKVKDAAPASANGIEVEVSIKVGPKKFTVESLVDEASKSERIQEKEAELEAARQRLAELEKEVGKLKG